MPPFLECVQWGPSSVKYASSIDGFGDQKDVPFDEARRGDAPHSTKLFFFSGQTGLRKSQNNHQDEGKLAKCVVFWCSKRSS